MRTPLGQESDMRQSTATCAIEEGDLCLSRTSRWRSQWHASKEAVNASNERLQRGSERHALWRAPETLLALLADSFSGMAL
jgi:hypothetical protein